MPLPKLLLMALVVLGLGAPLQGSAQLTKLQYGACDSDLDCVLLGTCVDGKCQCNEGWTGANCEQIDLIPRDSLDGFDDPYYPAWGGRTIYAKGQYHFVASYMRNRCDISDYGTNSAYLRATGDNPLGPFSFQEEVLPPFHHGAHVDRDSAGNYLIFGDGRDMPESTVQTNCALPLAGGGRGLAAGAESNDSNPSAAAGPSAHLRATSVNKKSNSNLYPIGDSPQDVHMVAVSKSVTGPWEQHIILRTDLSRHNNWDCNVTNLAPLLLDNGTIIMAFRSKSCVPQAIQAQACGYMCQFIGLSVSQNGWRGPFIKQSQPIGVLTGNEDPFLWQDTKGFHILMHGKVICGLGGIDTCGSMGYSPDLVSWYQSPYPVYGASVKLTRGSEQLQLRQRPKILFNSDGVPLVLYNGGKRYSNAYVRNFAFPINTSAMRNFSPPPPCPPKPQFKALCTLSNKGVPRNAAMCATLGTVNCVWCSNSNTCMYGGSTGICTALYPDKFYQHC